MRGKSCRSWSGDGGTGAPSGAAGPAGRAAAAAVAATTTSPGEGCSGAEMWRTCGPETAGPPHTTAGGGGRAGRCRWAQETSGRLRRGECPWARAPPPLVEWEEAGRGLGWVRRANAHWCSRAAGPVYTRARARCAALLARVAADVRVPGLGICSWCCGSWARAGVGGARPPATPAFGARALLLGGDAAAARTRRTPLLRGAAASWREARSVRKVVGWALPALVTSPDRRGLGLGRNRPALPSDLRIRSSARRARLLVLLEECSDLKLMCREGAALFRN